jgi:MerR family transcriptional regulator/heat shock protein HspR
MISTALGDLRMPDDDADAPVYVISVAARLVCLPARVLGSLDREGVAVPQRRLKNRRLYSQNDSIRPQRVRFLTEVPGVNLNGVTYILEIEQRNGGGMSS